MPLPVAAEPVPFVVGTDGAARIDGSRVTLDTVIRAFKRGESPEQILEAYSTLKPFDVYAVIAYYLRHEAEVEAYLREREQLAQAVRAVIDSASDRREIRERLRARQAERSRSSV